MLYISNSNKLSIRLGTNELAKYPFLNESSLYVKETHFDLHEFDRSEMKYIVDRAYIKIDNYLKRGSFDYDLSKFEVEVLTFMASLLILKATSIDTLTKKFSLLESMRFEKYLISDLKYTFNDKQKELILLKIFYELFKIEVKMESITDIFYKIKITDYIRHSIGFHEQEWKLINRTVSNGYVYLNSSQIVRLFRNEISLLIYNKIKNLKIDVFPGQILEKSSIIKDYYNSIEQNAIISKNEKNITPPCIEHIYKIINNGENLPHSARLLLATFLIYSGNSIEEIDKVFQKLPDYNEKITRYQLEHLSGNKGNTKKYFVPSCEKIKVENLCHETNICRGIINPVQLLINKRKEID